LQTLIANTIQAFQPSIVTDARVFSVPSLFASLIQDTHTTGLAASTDPSLDTTGSPNPDPSLETTGVRPALANSEQ